MSLSESRLAMIRHIVDGAPAVLFLAALLITRNFQFATWFVIGGAIVALIASYALERRFRPLPTATAVLAVVFGGSSLILHRADILQMKMTILDGLLGSVLIGGVLIGRNPLKALMGASFDLSDRAWRTLAIRYALFWWASAAANEVVRRTQSQQTWAMFKVGVFVAAILFALAQAPFLLKHNRRGEVAPLAEPPESGA